MNSLPWLPYRILCLACTGLLAACASTPPQFYTLAPAAGSTSHVSASTPPLLQSPAATGAPAAFSLQPVRVPAQVDQSNVLVRTGANELTPDYDARWAAALGEDIGAALATHLRTAGLLDLTDLGGRGTGPLWRLQVQVTAFDLPTEGPTTLEALWRARRLDAQETEIAILCQFRHQESSQGSKVPDLVAAQRQAVTKLASEISTVLLSGTPGANCSRAEPSA